ncbi:PREDICTED: uncharacterized protein LOC109227565 [Nicotiana attenuata]|uniref:uncharacterized protein LOC109227565 n=1 Tax=Nicotiana attenuata TaxID=49451 RepID=UPI000904DF99|nr:PREDICTED: uncharacterized protein LOC109227565 [Nicotiana attenuata]
MDDYIITRFHYGGAFINDGGLAYVGEKELEAVFPIDKCHFSMMELLYHTKKLGYPTIEVFYYRTSKSDDSFKVESDSHLLDIVKDLVHCDFLDLYVLHVVNEPEVVETVGQTTLLTGPEVGETDNVSDGARAINDGDINTQTTAEKDLGVDDSSQHAEKNVDGAETDLENSSDSQRDGPKKKIVAKNEIPLGEAGIDRGFEDIGRNKAARYTGRLGGDEQFIDSSEADSDDSRDELDPEAVRGVDLPARRNSSKLRYDDDCVVAIFEVGMIFENVVEFRKVVIKYAIEYKVQLKLKPNEKERVRATCKEKRCNWLFYAALDRDSGEFMVKNYHPVHKCNTSNKNKLCTYKFVANEFKDEITKQPYMKIWELQELCRDRLGLYVGRTICQRAKQKIMKEFMGDWKQEFARLCDYIDQKSN